MDAAKLKVGLFVLYRCDFVLQMRKTNPASTDIHFSWENYMFVPVGNFLETTFSHLEVFNFRKLPSVNFLTEEICA